MRCPEGSVQMCAVPKTQVKCALSRKLSSNVRCPENSVQMCAVPKTQFKCVLSRFTSSNVRCPDSAVQMCAVSSKIRSNVRIFTCLCAHLTDGRTVQSNQFSPCSNVRLTEFGISVDVATSKIDICLDEINQMSRYIATFAW